MTKTTDNAPDGETVRTRDKTTLRHGIYVGSKLIGVADGYRGEHLVITNASLADVHELLFLERKDAGDIGRILLHYEQTGEVTNA